MLGEHGWVRRETEGTTNTLGNENKWMGERGRIKPSACPPDVETPNSDWVQEAVPRGNNCRFTYHNIEK